MQCCLALTFYTFKRKKCHLNSNFCSFLKLLYCLRRVNVILLIFSFVGGFVGAGLQIYFEGHPRLINQSQALKPILTINSDNQLNAQYVIPVKLNNTQMQRLYTLSI